MIVDTHQHLLPWFYVNEVYDGEVPIATSTGRRSSASEWSIAWTLEEMDQGGVAAAVLSLPSSVWTGDPRRSARLARNCNEFAAELVRAHPDRLGMFASLPLPDLAASLVEIEASADLMGADGFVLMSSYQGVWLGDPSFEPVLAELDRRQTVVFVHPTVAPRFEHAMPGIPDAYLEYPFDTTRTIASLLMSGAITRHPGIRFLFAHFGGAVSILAERIARFAQRQVKDTESNSVPILNQLRRLYFDTASNSNLPAMAALRALIPDTHIVFGSDAPFLATSATLNGIKQAVPDDQSRLAIECRNALGILPRLRESVGDRPS